jgi:hypothetical protein
LVKLDFLNIMVYRAVLVHEHLMFGASIHIRVFLLYFLLIIYQQLYLPIYLLFPLGFSMPLSLFLFSLIVKERI